MADRVLKTLRPEGAKPRQLLRKLGRRFMALKSGILKNMLLLVSDCLLYTSPSPRDATLSRMPSSA